MYKEEVENNLLFKFTYYFGIIITIWALLNTFNEGKIKRELLEGIQCIPEGLHLSIWYMINHCFIILTYHIMLLQLFYGYKFFFIDIKSLFWRRIYILIVKIVVYRIGKSSLLKKHPYSRFGFYVLKSRALGLRKLII